MASEKTLNIIHYQGNRNQITIREIGLTVKYCSALTRMTMKTTTKPRE